MNPDEDGGLTNAISQVSPYEIIHLTGDGEFRIFSSLILLILLIQLLHYFYCQTTIKLSFNYITSLITNNLINVLVIANNEIKSIIIMINNKIDKRKRWVVWQCCQWECQLLELAAAWLCALILLPFKLVIF